ncbi:universal stress protein [Opitutus sp. GAS368]|jgi:manganese transport protein|uniref:universal stress protein n=1 Tax=Opitutus sp. GAS368 TaxID=1882749 RepID=UPI00087AD05B|nr:universal stress protein [Opitutus sp. GAS368]SDS63098.1 manganese transport protein [Opitutus sp. GAS368]
MYTKILVALENGPADGHLLPHICQLARQVNAELLLLHVADGWAARNFEQLKLAESDEMRADSEYLESTAERLRLGGLRVDTLLALGNPPTEIVKIAASSHCDLIALASHGHKLIGDLLHGSTIDKVRHNTTIPLLVVCASRAATKPPF